MEILIVLGIIVSIAIWRNIVVQRKAEKEFNTVMNEHFMMNEIKAETTKDTGSVNQERIKQITNNDANDVPDTMTLMESVLSELGCQPKKETDSELSVAYQGENFIVRTGGLYAQIWDPAWASISVNDPNFENMKTAANIANFDFGPTILYTAPNEEGMVALHIKQDILLISSIPHITDYMRSTLDSFFEKKEIMRGRFHSLINQKQEPLKHQRPVGFATSEKEN